MDQTNNHILFVNTNKWSKKLVDTRLNTIHSILTIVIQLSFKNVFKKPKHHNINFHSTNLNEHHFNNSHSALISLLSTHINTIKYLSQSYLTNISNYSYHIQVYYKIPYKNKLMIRQRHTYPRLRMHGSWTKSSLYI